MPNIKSLVVSALLGLLLPVAGGANAQQVNRKLSDEQVAQITSGAGKSIAFVENKGQWPDHVLYRADVEGGQMLATPEGMLIGVFDHSSMSAASKYDMQVEQVLTGHMPGKTIQDLGPAPALKGFGWRLNFIGGNKANPQSIAREGENKDLSNYLSGDASTTATGVHSYNVITYKDVYPGVQVKYYTAAGGNLENDIIVNPGANAGLISMQIEGVEGLKLDAKGGLVLPAPIGDITIPSPVCYLVDANGTRTEIKVKYRLNGKNTLSFEIPDYDKSQTLVIDPIVMRWATWIASNTSVAAHCHGIDVDAAGNIYVVSRGGNGLVTVGAFQTTYTGTGGAVILWISKYQEPAIPGGSGTCVWQTYLGGTNTTNPYACTVGPDGYLYIAGVTNDNLNTTYGTGAPTPGWTQRATIGNGGQQVFVAKVAPSGAWAEVRDIGSAAANLNPSLYDLRILNTGSNSFDLIAAGYVTQQTTTTADGDIPVAQYPNGTAVTTGGGRINGYALRLTNDLNTLKWTKQFASPGNTNEFFSTVVDGAGHVLLGGHTNGTADISYNDAIQTTLTGTQDGWLMSVDSATGNANWSRYFNSGAAKTTGILCMEINQQKTQLVIGGMTTGLSTSNLPTATYQTTYPGGGQDFYIASLPIGGNANTTWGTYFGGNGTNTADNMMGLNIDENNDVYILGYTNSKFTPTTIPATGNPIQTTTYDPTNYDALFFKLSGSTGDSLLFYTFLGGKSNEEDPTGERGIKFNNCRIYLAITSESNDFPLTRGTIDSVYTAAQGSVYLPLVVSMANPPDLANNSITSGGTQSIACGQAPQLITASTPAYIIPTIIRDGVGQTNGTAGAYPSGVPVISSYQWQYSTNNGLSWTSIPGATTQNYTPAAIDSFTGTYLFRRIINGDYCSLTGDTLAVVTVTVTPAYAPPAITTNSPLCAGQTLTLATPAQTGFTYAWSGPSNFRSTSQDTSIANVSASNVGLYYLTIKNSANGCPSYPDSALVAITSPLPPPVAGSNSPVCSGDSIKLSATGAGSSFAWTGPNGFTSSSQNPVIAPATLANAGTYQVTQSAGGSCISSPATVTVIINTTPAPVAGNNGPVCAGTTLNLTATTISGATYSWRGPNGFTSNLQNPTITNVSSADTGTYYVIATVNGCSSAPAATIVVVSPAPAPPVVGSNGPVCQGSTLNLTASNIAGATYTWTGPNGFTSNLQNPNINSVTLADSGTYSVFASISGCVSDTGTTYVVVIATPALPVVASNSPVCSDSTLFLTVDTVSGASYSWTGPNGFSSTAADTSITNATSAASGTYTVVISVAGCQSGRGVTSVVVNTTPSPVATNNGPVCSGSFINLYASTIANATYVWSGPNGFTANVQNPSISGAVASDSGVYSVIAYLNGCASAPGTTTVGVNSTPAPNARNNGPLCVDDTLRLHASTVFAAVYSWTGPNGFVSNAQNPVIPNVTAADSGVYSVIAIVKGCNSSSAGTTTVVINPIPTITVSNNGPVCDSSTLNLTASSYPGATYSWSGPNGFTSNLQNPSITPAVLADSGTYSVTVTALGCKNNAPLSTVAVINAVPVAPVTGSNSPLCVGDNLNLTADTIANTTYSWSGPNGFTSNVQNPSVTGVTVASAGLYTVTATISGCASYPGSVTVVVNTIPATPVITSNGPVCAGANLNLSVNAVSGASYSWTGPNGFTLNAQDTSIISATASDSGIYTLIETVNGCSSGADSTNVVVYALPAAPVAVSNSPVCTGGTINLTASSIPGANYSWSSPGGFSSNVQDPVITNAQIADGTTYTVVASVNGCAGASAQVTVIVGPPPVASFTSTAPQCAGAPVNFTNTGTTGAGITFNWNFGAGSTPDSSYSENPTGIEFATGGSIPVIFSVNNGLCTVSDTQNITVISTPKAAFVNDGPVCFPPGVVIFTDSSSGTITSWQWNFGTGATPATSTNSGPDTVTYAATGIQTVTLIVSNGTCSDTATGSADVGVVGADFTSSVPENGDNGCLGQPVNFYEIGNLGANAQSFWNFGFGANPATSTAVNPTNILYDTTGAKIVTHIVSYTNAGCTLADTFVHIITINPIPVTTFTSTAPVCSNTAVNFNNTGSSGVNYTYFWDFGSGASPSTSIAENPAGVSYTSTGVKTVTFTITNGFYCTIQATQTIVIDSTPTASFSSTAPQCTGIGVDFNNASTATGVTYAWDFGPGATPATSTSQNPTGVVYSTAGTKTVTLVVTNTNSSCTATATLNININQGPTASFSSNAPQCSTVPINFINTGSTGGSWSYAWDFGLGASPAGSSAENPSGIAYSSSGSKTVSLTVSGGGCTQTNTQTIVVNATPTASFITNAPQCTGQPVNFTSTGTSAGVTWAWDFGSGATPATSTVQNPNGVVYSTAGITGTTLTVTDTASGCSATVSQNYNINLTPVATFTSTAPQCSNVGINFTNTGSTGSNWAYSWDLGQGAIPAFSSSANPSGVMYTSSGSKTITFTISSQYCTQTSTQTIVINSTPVASFTSTAPQCTGQGVNFTNTGTTSGVTYAWSLGNGATPAIDTVQNPAGVVYATAGTIAVTLTTTDTTSGCSVIATNNITIHQTPTASFTSNAPQCSTVPINFTNTGSTGGNWSYNWDFGQGANPALSAAENPGGILYSSSGTKTVTFTISDQNCTQSATQNIVINQTPSAGFTSTAPQCTGLGVDFTSNGTSANVTWLWNFGAGSTPATDSVQNPVGVIYSTAGTKTATLTVTDTTSGCSVTATNTFIIHQTPTASFTSNAPQCSTVPINFTNTGSTGNNWFYSWNLGQNAIPAVSSAQNPSGVVYSSAGSKVITFTISDQNCTQTVEDTIVINSTPTASFNSTAPQCTGLPVNFSNTGTVTGVTWLWNFGNGASPATDTVQNPSGVIYSIAGTQNVTLTTTDTGSGCSVTATVPIAIHQTPTASFTSNAPQCSGIGIDFTNTGSTGGNWSYSWNFGVGAAPSTSTGENPTGILYGSSGSKVVTFTISGQGCTQTTADTINILQTPVASFTSNAPKCTGLPVSFVNTGTSNGVTWAWNFGPGATPATSTAQYPSGIIYSSAGIIAVTLTISDSTSSCTVTATSNINIYQTPTATFTSNAPQCTNTPINFTNTGSTGGNWTYDWDFGQGAVPAVSSSANPAGVLYDSSGFKIVTFTVADANCAATTTDTISISNTPIANFTSTAPQCSGLPVNFTNTGSTTGVNWAWNLGTGATPATSALQNPTGVVYSTAGITMVTLTITDTASSCSATVSNTINIYQTPTATFNSNAPQCTNAPVNFTNTGSTGSNWSYAWDFGQNAIPAVSSSENTNGVLYDSSGTKLVTFTISDANCSNTIVDTIVINSTPVASFTSTAPVCSGLPVSFANTGTSSNVNWLWNLGTGATPSVSALQNPAGVTYDSSGIITVSLTITDVSTSCSSTAISTINIYQTPTAVFTSSAPQCANSPVNFTNTGSTGSDWSYAWDFGSNALPAVSSSENPTGILYDSSGTKTVTFTIQDAHCSQTTTQAITVSPLPIAYAGADTTICANVSVRLGGTNLTPGATYQWFPSSTLDNPYVPNPIASPTASITNYSVSVTAPSTGCVSTSFVVVTMLNPLIANPGVNSQICLNDSVEIGAGLIEGEFYKWTPATGLSSTNIPNPVASPAQTTTYTLVVTDTSGCAPVSDNVTVTVNPLPNANAGPDDTIQTGGTVQLTGTGGVQYVWSPAAGLSNANLFNPVASPDSSTIYVLTVTNVFGCQSTDTMEVYVFGYETPYWIPSAFTPNGDGHNDVLYVRGGGFLTFEFQVFNRYGEEMFDSKDINEGWDGKAPGGQPAPLDAYVYKINGVLNSGKTVDVKGIVNLVR